MAIKLPVVITAWKNFELSNFQQHLDETASEITLKQDESEISRKKLVEQLKEFRKNSSEEVRIQASSLIKSFQKEVDFLNKRSKFAEASFLKIYQKILDIVDPTPSLEYCATIEKKIGRLEDLEIESKNLRETLKEYNEEFKEVKNQEVTIKTLKEKLKNLEDEFETSLNSKSKDIEKKVNDMYYDKEQLLLETHKQTLEKLHESELQSRNYQQSIDRLQSELFEAKSKLEDKTVAKSDEVEILMNDLEKANIQSLLYQKEISKLNEMLSSKDTVKGNAASYPHEHTVLGEVSSLEAELVRKDNEISQLVEDVKHLQHSLNYIQENSSHEISEIKGANDCLEKKLTHMEQKLLIQKDYDELKRELAIIKSVEFSSSDDELGNNYSILPSKPLELLLLEKNKFLQNENTSLKLLNSSLTTETSNLKKEKSDLNILASEQGKLIIQLESDMLSLQNLSPLNHSNSGTPNQHEIISAAINEVEKSMCTHIEVTNAPLESSFEGSIGTTDINNSIESVLPIISAQRERFRIRNEGLEVELTAKNSEIHSLQNEADSLRADNIKLYEKIRFLQSYDRNKATSDSTAESKYSNQYENGLDPFLSFSQKEKQRRYATLSPFEKITLFFGQLILSNKTARLISFIYFCLLHILIFLVLYKLAHTESWRRDLSSDCAKKFAEHMFEVHGNHDFDMMH